MLNPAPPAIRNDIRFGSSAAPTVEPTRVTLFLTFRITGPARRNSLLPERLSSSRLYVDGSVAFATPKTKAVRLDAANLPYVPGGTMTEPAVPESDKSRNVEKSPALWLACVSETMRVPVGCGGNATAVNVIGSVRVIRNRSEALPLKFNW